MWPEGSFGLGRKPRSYPNAGSKKYTALSTGLLTISDGELNGFPWKLLRIIRGLCGRLASMLTSPAASLSKPCVHTMIEGISLLGCTATPAAIYDLSGHLTLSLATLFAPWNSSFVISTRRLPEATAQGSGSCRISDVRKHVDKDET